MSLPVTGRQALNPPGTVGLSDVVHAGEDFYVRTFSTSTTASSRWGDYSGICLDPVNDRFFCVFNEFADERGTPTGPPEFVRTAAGEPPGSAASSSSLGRKTS